MIPTTKASRWPDAARAGGGARTELFQAEVRELTEAALAILQLEERVRRATVIDEKDLGTDEVRVGSFVHVKDQKTGDSQKFQIVGSAEASPAERKLSNESPIGKALIGHKRNEVVSVDVPRGPKKKLKITKIEA